MIKNQMSHFVPNLLDRTISTKYVDPGNHSSPCKLVRGFPPNRNQTSIGQFSLDQ